MQREIVYVFIDSQNLHLGIKSLGWELDYKRFYVFLQNKFRVKKIFLFLGYISGYHKLYDLLEKIGYILVFKPVVMGDKIKGNIDVDLVIQVLWYKYNNYNKAIIISGDGDFLSLYEVLIKENKLLKIIIPNYKGQSSLLKRFEKYKYFLEYSRKQLKK